ncbi:MAG: DUF4330 domain-containing protein [Clostridia bacterium]|nr:DUF4330 domain-containing protein [Clostridia bacterium]
MFSKNGKLFGKISVIDIAVVLLLVVLVVGVALRFSGSTGGQLVSGSSYECVVRVKNVRDYTVKALEKGGEVYDKTTKEYIGTIVGVTSEPAAEPLALADGTHALAPAEGRYTAYVTISFTGKESNDGYYTAANQQISPGGTLTINAKFSQCDCTVVDVYPVQ